VLTAGELMLSRWDCRCLKGRTRQDAWAHDGRLFVATAIGNKLTQIGSCGTTGCTRLLDFLIALRGCSWRSSCFSSATVEERHAWRLDARNFQGFNSQLMKTAVRVLTILE